MMHKPGKATFVAHSRPRYILFALKGDAGTAFLAASLAAMPISIDKLASCAKNNNAYWADRTALLAGTAPTTSKCKEFPRYIEELCPRDGILMHNNQPVIPTGIQVLIWNGLHAAHQGRPITPHRAMQKEVRPGYTADVRKGVARSHTDDSDATATLNEDSVANPQANLMAAEATVASPQAASLVAKARTLPCLPANQTVQNHNRVCPEKKRRDCKPPFLLARRGGQSSEEAGSRE